MRVLNLAYPENSPIKFTISSFPDGQQSVDIGISHFFIKGEDVRIEARIKSFRDLEIVIGANQALKEMGARNIFLYVPYFLGARSDRKFKEGGVNYLKKVICPIINSQGFYKVITLDPHSDVLEACLDNFQKSDNFSLVEKALSDIDNKEGAKNRIVLVSPDGGALKKIFDVSKKFQIPNIVTAMKHRDIQTGKITHTEVPDLSSYSKDHKFVIVDDICDGGRTFIELAKVIRSQNKDSEIYLIVTHGVFSNGLYELSQELSKIYCTNSYMDCEVEYESEFTVDKEFLMQLDVFKS